MFSAGLETGSLETWKMLCPALENTAPAVLWPLCARSGCAVATVRSKWLFAIAAQFNIPWTYSLCSTSQAP